MGAPDEIFKEVCKVLDDTRSLEMTAKEVLSDANIVFVLGMYDIYYSLSRSCKVCSRSLLILFFSSVAKLNLEKLCSHPYVFHEFNLNSPHSFASLNCYLNSLLDDRICLKFHAILHFFRLNIILSSTLLFKSMFEKNFQTLIPCHREFLESRCFQ